MKSKKQKTLVSILMPVYNAEKYLSKALDSIISQSYSTWELIAVDDWSTDDSYQILQKFARKDSRIKTYRNGQHRGVSGAANLAISMTKSQYIVRMDADDIMHPQRIEKQLDFLRSSRDVVVVGTQCVLIDQDTQRVGEKRFPTSHSDIYRMIFRSIPIQQPSMMINRGLLPKDFVFYDNDKQTAEEVELLFKLSLYGKAANLPEYLHFYRLHEQNTSLKDPKKTFYLTFLTRMKAIKKHGAKLHFSDFLFNLMQLLVVVCLPKNFIYPLYSFWRNNRQFLHFYLPFVTVSKYNESR